MNGIRLVAAVALLVLPALARPLVGRLPAASLARLSAVSLAAGLVLLEISLLHEAAPAFLHWVGLSRIAAACHALGGHLLGGHWLGGLVAGVGAVAVAAGAWHGMVLARRARRALRGASALGWCEQRGECKLVTLPTGQPVALGVPGAPPIVVVSEGLVDALEAEELDAVVRHEQAHLRHRHPRYLLLMSAAGALARLPAIRDSLTVLQLAIERWADDAATGNRTEQRAATRRALLRLGSETVPRRAAPPLAPGLTLERVRALERPGPPSTAGVGPALSAGTAALAVAAAALAAVWVVHVYGLLNG